MDRYGTVSGFAAYHAARGRNPDIFDDDDVNAALLVASEWLDGMYRAEYAGEKVGEREQVREWPRRVAYDVNDDLIPSDAVPVEVDNATYEAAFIEATSPGSLLKNWTPGKYDRVSVDGAISVTYAKFSDGSEAQTQFLTVARAIAPVLTSTGADFAPLSGPASRI